MGYSEKVCRICGVSFNIGRIRRPEDPAFEGWLAETVADRAFNDCDAGDGCRNIEIRRLWKENQEKGIQVLERRDVSDDYKDDREDDDEDDDLDFVLEESTDEERYEYESDDDCVSDASGTGRGNSPMMLSDPHPFSYPLSVIALHMTEAKAKKEPPYLPEYEHIAGPTCRNDQGYNGHTITAEEMRGSNTAQCLMPKPRHWVPEKYDQDFELQSNFFLSGITDHMPSRDWSPPIVFPARHGVEDVPADGIPDRSRDDNAMPFHTSCFDIFARLSRHHFGYVDVNGLMSWYEIEGDWKIAEAFMCRDSDVARSSNDFWNHIPGLEYLAANPVLVPRLDLLLRSVIDTDPSFSFEAGAFQISPCPATILKDAFGRLPQELRLEVISYLNSREIANMRLATPAFRQLPKSLWRRLIREEMPWLWETWSDEKPYFWTTVSASALKEEEEARIAIDDRIQYFRFVFNVGMPELLEDWMEAERAFFASRQDSIIMNQSEPLSGLVYPLLSANTNWYQLYTEITRHWNDLKGLRNRRRIWNAAEEIIIRIRKYRLAGAIVD